MPRTNPELIERRRAMARVLGQRLSVARAESRLTQQEAAQALGLRQQALARTESGTRTLSFVEALDLADLYGLSPLDLDPRHVVDDGRRTG